MKASAPPAQDAGGKVDKSVVPIKLKVHVGEYCTCRRRYLVDPSYKDVIEFLQQCWAHGRDRRSKEFSYTDTDQDKISVLDDKDWEACLTYWRLSGAATLYLDTDL